jgi:hypothetical protein
VPPPPRGVPEELDSGVGLVAGRLGDRLRERLARIHEAISHPVKVVSREVV